MFDPTIFDNLKVVLEGALYDLDAEGIIMIIGREDLVDLASMARTLQMDIRLPAGRGRAAIRLSSALPDFAAELRGLSAAGVPPGAGLGLSFHLPGEAAAHFDAIRTFLTEQWGSEAEILYEEKRSYTANTAPDTAFSAMIRFYRKIDESHVKDLGSLVEHFVASLEFLERELV